MKRFIISIFLALIISSCSKPQKLVGGPCEGCEAVFEYGIRTLTNSDTLPGFNEQGTKIKITGTIYKPDGRTPAGGVILYVYHTNSGGIYETRGNETGWGIRHGFMRGWIKTDKNGEYSFYTIKPGSYPDWSSPAHIHATILEPDGKYYWIQDYHFADDTLLSERELSPENPRGGSSGLIELTKINNILTGKRDIILGKNIPGYDN
jgi:protocatechuate 3,4-dioxygenase, beta subunit